MNTEIITEQYIIIIVTSVILGTLARILTLIVDYRQYPSYPNGYLTHLFTGFIASALGAIAVPAIISTDFAAVTFLALAVEQFREVRKVENESLQALEDTDSIYRGAAYIDGIAKTFEARNYFSLLVSFMAGLTMEVVSFEVLWINILSGVVSASIVFFLLKRFSKGKKVGDIADIRPGKIRVENSELFVDDIFVTNHLGTDEGRKLLQEEGIAAVIYPREDYYRITLDHIGQRQAILFEACRALGLKRYHFTRKDFNKGRVVIVFVPLIRDEDQLIKIIKNAPLLETVKKSRKVMKTNFTDK